MERVCQQQQQKKMVKGKARGYEMLATAIFYLILQTMKGMIKDPVGNLRGGLDARVFKELIIH